jgi:serine/threonine protein kinase/tetratricopeptide (TPR) repeat protein
MSPGDHVPAERLTAALDIWLHHRQAPDCSEEELLARHPSMRDLLEPLIVGVEEPLVDDSNGSRQFGCYRLLREIGRGGVGIVHEAVQEPLGRHVALKVLSGGLLQHAQAVARFRREGGLLARLQHPHIVPIYDAGVEAGVPFHAMELIEGASLHDLLLSLRGLDPTTCDGGTLANALASELAVARDADQAIETIGAQLRARSHVEVVVRLVHTIANALAAAHQEGILHRDVKPANILLRRDGIAKLSDFGLARDLREPGLTQPGGFVGTPYYVSPEQAAGRISEVDARSDVFSLAVVLYELLVLARPFQGDTSEEVLANVQAVEPHQLLAAAGDLPLDILAVLDCALQRHREDRYASMAAFALDLSAILELRPVSARRRGAVSRALLGMRRRPKQVAMVAAVITSAMVAFVLWVHLANQQSRIDVGLAIELLPAVEHEIDLAMLELEASNHRGAVARVAAAAELAPNLPIVLAVQAHVLWVVGDRDGSEECLARLTRVAPDVAAQVQPDAVEPVTSLAWFARGWQHLKVAHADGGIDGFREAAKCFRRAIDRSPEPRRLFHCQYLHALTHTQDWPAVIAMSDDVGHLWPESPVVAYWRGFALLAVDVDQARPLMERACQQLPGLAEPMQRLAKVLELQGDLAGAERWIRDLRASQPHLLMPRLLLARLMRRQHQEREALAMLDDLVVDWQSTFRVPSERAAVLLALGRSEEALQSAEVAVATAPEAPQPYQRRAMVLLQLGRHAEALADIDKACAMRPNNYEFLQSRATVCIRMARWQEAAESLRQVVALQPKAKGSWCDLATMYRRMQDLDAADAALAKAEQVDPGFWLLHLQRGHVLRARQQPAQARDAFQLAADANLEHGEAVINLAGFHMAAREYEQGLALLAEARRRQPELWQGWRPAIATLTSLGRHQEAEQLLLTWCDRHPRDGAGWLQLASLRRQSPEHTAEAARAALTHASSVLGEHSSIVLHELGEQLLQGGDQAGADALFRRVLASKRVPAKVREACRARLAK